MNKMIQGAFPVRWVPEPIPGPATVVYELVPSIYSIKKDKDDVISPRRMTCALRITDGNEVTLIDAVKKADDANNQYNALAEWLEANPNFQILIYGINHFYQEGPERWGVWGDIANNNVYTGQELMLNDFEGSLEGSLTTGITEVKCILQKDGIEIRRVDLPIIPDGKDGADSVMPMMIDLDNEMDSVALDKDGKLSQAVILETKVHIWDNGKELKLSNIVTSGFEDIAEVSSVADTGEISITLRTNIPIQKRSVLHIKAYWTSYYYMETDFMLTGVREGADGKPAETYQIIPSTNSIVKKKDGTISPATISVQVFKTVGDVTTKLTTENIDYVIDGKETNTVQISSVNIDTKTIKDNIEFSFYRTEGKTSVLKDSETVRVVSDGDKGDKGVVGTFTAVNVYTAAQCKDYCTRKAIVGWADNEIKESNKNAVWSNNLDQTIILIIPCDDGSHYISYQTIKSATTLLPQSYWVNKNGLQGAFSIGGSYSKELIVDQFLHKDSSSTFEYSLFNEANEKIEQLEEGDIITLSITCDDKDVYVAYMRVTSNQGYDEEMQEGYIYLICLSYYISHKGEVGAAGLDAPYCPVTQWAVNVRYRNEFLKDANGNQVISENGKPIKVIDTIYLFDDNGDFVSAHMCAKSHTSSVDNKPGTNGGKQYWTDFNNMSPSYFPFVMAPNALIKIMQGNSILIQGSDGVVTAGMTGEGTLPTSVRQWAGDTFENRNSAPFRVTKKGSVWASDAYIKGTMQTSIGKVDTGLISSTEDIYDSISEAIIKNDYIHYIGSIIGGGVENDSIPTNKSYVGRRILVMFQGSVKLSGNFIYCGRKLSSVTFSQQSVDMFCVETDNTPFWFILSVNDFLPIYGEYGKAFQTLAYGKVVTNDLNNVIYHTFDGSTLYFDRYAKCSENDVFSVRIRMPDKWFDSKDDVYVTVTAVGGAYTDRNPYFANVRQIWKETYSYISFDVVLADDKSWNEGTFFFEVKNMRDFFNV